MKYDFEKRIDRIHGAGGYSAKWSESEMIKQMCCFAPGEPLPEDRLLFFVADMEFECAPELRAALQTVLDHGIYGYSGAPAEYYQAVVRWEKDRFGLEVRPERIRYFAGCHPAVAKAIETFTKPGDGVIVPIPSYNFKMDVQGTGRYYRTFPLCNDNGYYTMDWDAFEKLCREPQNTAAIFMQPHNPTGRVWTVEEIERIGAICRANNVLMISDDVHQDIHRKDAEVIPFMKVLGPQGLVMVTGISKTFNAAGLEVANMIVEDDALFEKLGPSFGLMNPFSIAGCIAGYTECDEWVDALNEYLDEGIDLVVERLHKEMPKLKVWKPQGTYILWIDFTDCGLPAEEVSRRIAVDARIGLTDGSTSDAPEGTIFKRMCCTSQKDVLNEAVDRLVAAFSDVL